MVLRPGIYAAGVCLAFVFLLRLSALSFGQQITYEYDALGRLTIVTTPEGMARYEYDAVGNILRITTRRNADVSGPVAILGVSPNSGAPGTMVRMYGRGFGATPAENQVAFNGTIAPVTAAASGSLTTTVPSGATTGAITLTAPQGSAVSPDVFTVLSTFTLTPSEVDVFPGENMPFQALLDGMATPDVTWAVNGLPGGNASLGTISSAGIYRAPQVQGRQTVTVQALLSVDPTRIATASVRLGLPSFLASIPVSVAVTKPPLTGSVMAAAASISVALTQSPTGNAQALAAPISVAVTSPLPTGSVVATSAPVSVSASPVVSVVMPATGRAGTTVGLTLTGQNLQGATAVRFLWNGNLDATLTATGVVAAGNGASVTCSLTIGGTATQGVRVVEVVTPQGISSGIDLGGNKFTVTP